MSQKKSEQCLKKNRRFRSNWVEFLAHKVSIVIRLLARRNSLFGTKIPLFRQVTNLRHNPLNCRSILGRLRPIPSLKTRFSLYFGTLRRCASRECTSRECALAHHRHDIFGASTDAGGPARG